MSKPIVFNQKSWCDLKEKTCIMVGYYKNTDSNKCTAVLGKRFGRTMQNNISKMKKCPFDVL